MWSRYLWRRQRVIQAHPNLAHQAITRLAERNPQITVITLNIDDLHGRAGSQDVVPLHGSPILPNWCTCHRPAETIAAGQQIPHEGGLVKPPLRGRYNGRLSPGVMRFGKDLPSLAWKAPRSQRETAT